MYTLRFGSNRFKKHVKKSLEFFLKSKTRKNDRQNFENNIFCGNQNLCLGVYICTKLERFILIYKAMIAKMSSTYF